jgi:SPP1 family predicted phage head-tail adaptor
MIGRVSFSEFDTQITIESATTVKNSVTNEPEQTWSTLKTIKAKELGPASREGIEASQQVALSTVRYKIYRDTALTEIMRINKNNVYFYISGIQDFGRQGFMILTAEKRDNV